MLLKVIATGRDWSNKLAPSEAIQAVAGVRCKITEFDAWDGPTQAGERGQYFRFTSLSPVAVRDDRFPHRQGE